jgi:hypothetical protein
VGARLPLIRLIGLFAFVEYDAKGGAKGQSAGHANHEVVNGDSNRSSHGKSHSDSGTRVVFHSINSSQTF